MKKFDLQKALAGEPVVYENGEEVIDLKQFNTGVLVSLGKDGTFRKHTSEGLLDVHLTYISGKFGYDLFMAEKPKVKKTGWVNVYPAYGDKNIAETAGVFPTRDMAESCAAALLITTVQIEWEEEA